MSFERQIFRYISIQDMSQGRVNSNVSGSIDILEHLLRFKVIIRQVVTKNGKGERR